MQDEVEEFYFSSYCYNFSQVGWGQQVPPRRLYLGQGPISCFVGQS